MGYNETAHQPQQIASFVTFLRQAVADVPEVYSCSLFGSRNWNAGVEPTGRYHTINREKLMLSALESALTYKHSIKRHVSACLTTLLGHG
jgi:hypothetical protein